MNKRQNDDTTKPTWLRYGFLAVVAAMVLAPVAVSASHTFTDVPDTHIFHSDIAWMADNGITSGCSATEYCPGDNVTRGQMAKFLRNVAENKVVDAATAETAGDADTLDGKSSSAFHEYDGDVPAFQTLYGAVGTGITATAASQIMESAISFQVPMPGDLDVLIVASGDPTPAGCSGDFEDPGADPGYLCVFIGWTANIGDFGFYRHDGTNNVTSPYGGQVYVRSSAAGLAEFSATWAATAPLTLVALPLGEATTLGAGE